MADINVDSEDLTIDNLDDSDLQKLAVLAARNGRSIEEEAREILTSAVLTEEPDLGGTAVA